MQAQEKKEEEFSLKDYFVPLTTVKAIHFIVIIGLIVFFNILFNGFVFDDGLQVVNNTVIHSLANIPYFFTGGNFVNTSTNQLIGIFYRPVLTSIYTFIYIFFGSSAFPFHLVQILLHIINAILVYLLIRKFLNSSLSFLLAIIFLVHPINQETVAYISNLQDILFFFFGMIALLLGTSRTLDRIKLTALCAFLLLGLLSKETAILFVPIILFYQYIFYRKRFSYTFIATIIGTTACYLFLRIFVAHLSSIESPFIPIMKASLIERIISIPLMVLYYLKIFFFPTQLALGQDWVVKRLTFNEFYLPLIFDIVFFVCILFLGVIVKRKNSKILPLFVFFFSWFVLGLLMHLQLIKLDASVADRWFYFPIVGLLGIIGIGLTTINPYLKIQKSLITCMAVIIVLLLVGRTILRNTNWINALTLCQHDLQIVFDSYPMQFACAGEWLKAGDAQEAKKHFAIVSKLSPDWGQNWYLYGVSMEYTGNVNTAQVYYRKDIALTNDSNAYIALASSYLKNDSTIPEAEDVIMKGLDVNPDYPKLLLLLAVVDYKHNNKAKALDLANKAYQLFPSPEAIYVIRQITNNQKVKIN